MKRSLVLAAVAVATLLEGVSAAPPVLPYEQDSVAAPQGRIDELVFARLKQLGIEPARPCSDGVFVRLGVPGRHRHAAHRRRGRAVPA
jgi:hypothetical protein